MRRGGRNAFVYVFWGLPIFMAACNTDAKEENLTREEAIIAKTIEQAESVESYTIEGGILDDIVWEDKRTEYTHSLFAGTKTFKPQRAYSQLEEKYGSGETEDTTFTAEIYENGNDIYVNLDNGGWQKPDGYEYDETDYEAAIRVLDGIENLEEMIIEETEDAYEIRYSEADEVLYDVYKPISSATARGITFVETGSPEVFLVIDKADYTVREFTMKFFYEDEAGSKAESVLTVEYRFDNINEVENIEIPAEVIKEAEQNE